ncbi:N-acetylneuraminate synthase family protein, partial [Candidatus Pelagibacter sp.]|nr:N-acetylneuraminate synthase family protein [Candidatus Pelagibacter sp.]
KKVGFDAVKFQKRTPEITTPKNKANTIRETPWGKITYLEYKKKLEFNRKEFNEIDKFCKKIDIKWFASPWDIESNDFLNSYKLKYNKIASPMLTNLDLLNAVAKQRRFTFISTGMSKMNDVETAVKIFKKHRCKFNLMHCVSAYPCQDKDLNLSLIQIYKKKFKVDVGYSGHEKSVSPGLMAACLGATSIERHVTLDRTMWGTDHAASLEEDGMRNLVNMIRKFEISLGDGTKKFLSSEKSKLKENKYW